MKSAEECEAKDNFFFFELQQSKAERDEENMKDHDKVGGREEAAGEAGRCQRQADFGSPAKRHGLERRAGGRPKTCSEAAAADGAERRSQDCPRAKLGRI